MNTLTHAQLATEMIEAIRPKPGEQLASPLVEIANAAATLALAEEQRTANLIALMEFTLRAAPSGVMSVAADLSLGQVVGEVLDRLGLNPASDAE